MPRFEILAQSYTSTQRIRKEVDALSMEAALRSASLELVHTGFYVLSVKVVG
jgi:hypothetical protein